MPSPWVLALVVVAATWAACALYVHFRGDVRHAWARQLTDHSTLLAPYNTLVYWSSGVPPTPFVDVAAFPELAPLARNWLTIREEARALDEAGRINPDAAFYDVAFNSFFDRGWRRFHLKWYGRPLPSAVALCPKTVALVESIPTVNAALFALLPPGGRLGKHRDPFAGSLRYHLGIATPNRAECRLWVDGKPYSWRDGEAVVFDETFIHNARNDTDEPRIILFCDVERPIRFAPVRVVNRFMARRVMPLLVSRNDETEPVGLASRVAGFGHRVQQILLRVKKRRRGLYYAAKYAALAALAYALVALATR